MLPEWFRVAKERMVVQDSYLGLAKNRIPTAFQSVHLISVLSPVSMEWTFSAILQAWSAHRSRYRATMM